MRRLLSLTALLLACAGCQVRPASVPMPECKPGEVWICDRPVPLGMGADVVIVARSRDGRRISVRHVHQMRHHPARPWRKITAAEARKYGVRVEE